MKKVVLSYSLWSVIVIIVAGYLNYLLFKSYSAQEIGGYISIILSMLFVFFGVKQYRDKENGGLISYGKALKVGVLITILPSLAFGVFDVIYVKYLDPGFMEKYYTQYKQQMQATMTAERYQQALQQLEQQKAMYANIYFNFFLMALTVFLIGAVVAALSALVLKRKSPVLTR